jgi:hypothetical protein
MEPDGGTTNIRNVSSAHWKRWLGRPVNACVTAIRAIMTMPPFSAALSSNPIASSHSGFRCVASGSAVM